MKFKYNFKILTSQIIESEQQIKSIQKVLQTNIYGFSIIEQNNNNPYENSSREHENESTNTKKLQKVDDSSAKSKIVESFTESTNTKKLPILD
jgi:hypothetical protein